MAAKTILSMMWEISFLGSPLRPKTLDRIGLLACKLEERNTFHVAQIIAFRAR